MSDITSVYHCVSCWIPSTTAEIPSINFPEFCLSSNKPHSCCLYQMCALVWPDQPHTRNIEYVSEKRFRNINGGVIFDFPLPRSMQQQPGFNNYITLMPQDYARNVWKAIGMQANPLTPHKDRRELTLEFMRHFLHRETVFTAADWWTLCVCWKGQAVELSHWECEISMCLTELRS